MKIAYDRKKNLTTVLEEVQAFYGKLMLKKVRKKKRKES